MAKGECLRPRPECPYFERPGGCFSDLDHIVPQRLGRSALAATYIQLSVNKQQICRWEHEKKTRQETEDLPPREDMIDAIQFARATGEISLSHTKLRNIFGQEWRDYLAVPVLDEQQAA